MHVEEGRLQAFADGELSSGERREVASHLDGCAICRGELAELEALAGEFSTAVAVLRPAPAALPASPSRAAPRPVRGWVAARRALPRAAIFVIGFAAAASATLPGSPVRRWLEQRDAPGDAQPSVLAPAVATRSAAEAGAEAGVSVAPHDGAVRVVLRRAAPRVLIRALLVDGELAGVYGAGEAAGARFHTAPGRIEVDGVDAGVLRVELPRAARTATVLVNGREYLRKEGDQIRLAVPAADRSATEVSFRVRP